MNKLPPNKNSQLLTLFGTLVGFALIDDFSAIEQNAIGNWFMLVGQILETNAAFLQQFNQQNQNFNKSNNFNSNAGDLDRLEKMVRILRREFEEFKKDNH